MWFNFGEISLYCEPLFEAGAFTPIKRIGPEDGMNHSNLVPADLRLSRYFWGSVPDEEYSMMQRGSLALILRDHGERDSGSQCVAPLT